LSEKKPALAGPPWDGEEDWQTEFALECVGTIAMFAALRIGNCFLPDHLLVFLNISFNLLESGFINLSAKIRFRSLSMGGVCLPRGPRWR